MNRSKNSTKIVQNLTFYQFLGSIFFQYPSFSGVENRDFISKTTPSGTCRSVIPTLREYRKLQLLFFAVHVIYKKNYSFSRIVFLFFSHQNCQLFSFKNK